MTTPPSTPTRPQPPESEAAAPFWDATRQHQLLYQWCTVCEQPVFFPREVCPKCLASSLEWKESTGRGTVYTFSNVHRPQMPNFILPAPYTVALVELEEGVRMMTNIINCDPNTVTVGMAVKVTWEELEDGRNLPLFEPLDAT
jgi:uncharacterized OB-fold protein